jgi:hypothetical protein
VRRDCSDALPWQPVLLSVRLLRHHVSVLLELPGRLRRVQRRTHDDCDCGHSPYHHCDCGHPSDHHRNCRHAAHDYGDCWHSPDHYCDCWHAPDYHCDCGKRDPLA